MSSPTNLISKSLGDAIAAELSAPVLTITLAAMFSRKEKMPPSTPRQKSLRGPPSSSPPFYIPLTFQKCQPIHRLRGGRAGAVLVLVSPHAQRASPLGGCSRAERGFFSRRRGMMLGPTSDTRERRRKLHRCSALRPWDRMNGRADQDCVKRKIAAPAIWNIFKKRCLLRQHVKNGFDESMTTSRKSETLKNWRVYF